MERDFDVIIVGGGGAGLAAAIEARRAGASVMVLEADTKLGGTTALSSGVFYACNTSVQRAAGIAEDTPKAMFDYIMTINQWSHKPDIVRLICEHCGPALDWLMSLGAVFPPESLVCSGVDTIPRGHPCQDSGAGIAKVLIDAAGASGIETALGTRVERLLFKGGRVIGVHAGGMDLRAPATMIATGGFGNNREMVARFFPSAARHGSWTYAVHMDAPFILGDGIAMADQLGAGIVGIDTGLMNPTPGFMKAIEAFLPPWTMVVNDQGKRFMPESAAYAISGYLVDEQTNHHAFAIFDEATLAEAGSDTRFADPYHGGAALSSWQEQTIRQQIAKGRVIAADSLWELAARIDIDGEGLAETVARYNEDCAHGVDTHSMKKTTKMFPLASAPFYGVEIKPAIIGMTGAGIDIDRDCRVLDTKGRVIPGLYAAGETLGVLVGKRYAGGGMGIGPAVTLGRIVGFKAAELAAGV